MPYPKLTLVITAIPLFFCEKTWSFAGNWCLPLAGHPWGVFFGWSTWVTSSVLSSKSDDPNMYDFLGTYWSASLVSLWRSNVVVKQKSFSTGKPSTVLQMGSSLITMGSHKLYTLRLDSDGYNHSALYPQLRYRKGHRPHWRLGWLQASSPGVPAIWRGHGKGNTDGLVMAVMECWVKNLTCKTQLVAKCPCGYGLILV